ncbi:MAG TPA: hypothetical protein DDX19_13845 [Rhodopirellula baltica]|uniref:Uncharacterized protein n=2 Tax=Rhodopirellula baltica TaxID=265606 RepID=K5DMX5_RHOBT|nr:hypothetical protein RBSH_00932 [Rhodopirellula baltica SH28]HBE63792.1 hypothetical protein [Rhodopirellula baltica]
MAGSLAEATDMDEVLATTHPPKTARRISLAQREETCDLFCGVEVGMGFGGMEDGVAIGLRRLCGLG